MSEKQVSEPTITCPKCGTEIKLTESLAAPLIASPRLQFEKQLRKGTAAMRTSGEICFAMGV